MSKFLPVHFPRLETFFKIFNNNNNQNTVEMFPKGELELEVCLSQTDPPPSLSSGVKQSQMQKMLLKKYSFIFPDQNPSSKNKLFKKQNKHQIKFVSVSQFYSFTVSQFSQFHSLTVSQPSQAQLSLALPNVT